MKSHVEGMRALTYYGWHCMDRAFSLPDPADRDKWAGLMDLLLPIARLYSAERGFKVTETAIQVHGRTGYFSDAPVQQFLRDIKPTSIWEAASGVHALLYVAQTLGQRDGRDLANLVAEMNRTIETYKDQEGLQDLARDLQRRVNLLGEMGLYFAECAKAGKAIVPIANATPVVHVMGDVCLGWLLFWQAGMAGKRLHAIYAAQGIGPTDDAARNALLSRNREAAFYSGKLHGARFFIRNVLPHADSAAAAIQNEDLSLMSIPDAAF
jgi:hypothetical protein